MKGESKRNKQFNPVIPADAEDETSNSRNLDLLKEELDKTHPSQESLKSLVYRTFSTRRPIILESDSFKSILQQYPWIKQSAFVSAYQVVMTFYLFLCCIIYIGYLGIWNNYATS